MIRRVRWECHSSLGHAAVLGPSKPRADATCRYCLACSGSNARLVRRTAPALERERAAARDARGAKAAQVAARETERLADYFTVHGVNLRCELHHLLRSPSAKALRANPPKIIVRTRRHREAGIHGRAWSHRNEILINRIPGQDAAEVRETLAHEVAHLLAPRTSHGPAWRTAFRVLVEEAYGVRIVVENRYGGGPRSLSAKLREIDRAEPLGGEPAMVATATTEHVICGKCKYEWLRGVFVACPACGHDLKDERVEPQIGRTAAGGFVAVGLATDSDTIVVYGRGPTPEAARADARATIGDHGDLDALDVREATAADGAS